MLRTSTSARLLGNLYQLSAEASAAGHAEESVQRCGALCAESLRGANGLLEDNEFEIDNGAMERAKRDIARGHGNWISLHLIECVPQRAYYR